VPNQEIIDYIKSSLSQNLSQNEIKESLLNAGWEDMIIEEAFSVIQEANMVKVAPQQSATKWITWSCAFVILALIFYVGVRIFSPNSLIRSSAVKEVPQKEKPITTVLQTADPSETSGGQMGLTIENKIEFTSAQLANLKTDLTKLYLKYKGQDKNTEPTKSKFDKELNNIFLKDLGVKNVTTENFGILLYPEISSIVKDIMEQFPSRKITEVEITKTPTSKIRISDINYTTISVSELSKYAKKSVTFKVVTNGETAECGVYDKTAFDASGEVVFSKSTYPTCYDSLIKNGMYSDSVYFSNSVSSGLNSDYFKSEGIDYITLEFYVTDVNKKESNRLKLTLTK